MAGISSLGVGSGVLNSDLVDSLVAAERKPVEMRLESTVARNEAMLSAFGKLRSAITELRLPMRQLSAPEAMRAFSVSSSNDDIAVTLDSKSGSRGSYSVNVTSLAKPQSLASGTFADKDSTSIGTGKLTISSGDTTKTLTVDDSNNTLEGLASSINDLNMGVSASVIDTGSGFRLVMSAEESGIANAIKISATDEAGASTAAGTTGLSRFVFDKASTAEPILGMEQTVAAQDAVMEINGIEITRSSNTVEGVIDGLTFDLKATGTSTVKVDQDSGAVADKVQAFVDKFNALQSTIKDLAGYNAETQQGGLLNGDSTVRGIQSQLRGILGRVVPGLEDAAVRSLADAGITTDWKTGGLVFDREEFISQLEEYPDDMTALFSEQGRASDARVEFVRSGLDTVPGSYDINVTQAATQGSLNYAAGDLGTISVAEGNRFTFKVDGETTVNVHLAASDYTAEEFAAAIQEQLNSNAALQSAGKSVQVAFDATNGLTFTSGEYGSKSSVSLTGLLNVSGISSQDGEVGQDVAGTIGGRAAKGDGQVLYLGSDSGDASGLQVRITGGATGPHGALTFIEGVGEKVVDLVSGLLDTGGVLLNRTESLQAELEGIAEERARLEERMTSYRERLVAQFSAADSLIAQLNNTKNFVTQQMEALAPQNQK